MRELKFEQGSLEWHRQRAGMVTGTSLKSATCTPAVQRTLLYELLAGMMTEPDGDFYKSEAMERGLDLEPVALKKASKTLSLKFETTGMMISDEIDNFGTSPDAVFRKGSKIVGGIEIKCPDSKKHIEYIINDEVPKDYRPQVLAQFIVNPDVKFWYFMSFDDRNYEIPEFYYLVKREDVWVELLELEAKLVKFLKMVSDKHLELTF